MKSNKRMKYLNKREKEELFKQIDLDTSIHHVRNRAIFYLAKYCALRASEVSLLNVCDYDPYDHLLYCGRLKGGRNNTLKIVDPLVCEAADHFYSERILDPSPSAALFTSQLGKPISRKMLDWLMKYYSLKTSIPLDKRHFHVLRHTRAMELIEYRTVDIRDVQWWLGHKEIQNTMIYLEYSAESKAALFDNISILEGGRTYEVN